MAYDPDDVEDDEVGLADLFTDRESESVAFAEALAAHRRRLDDPTADSPQGRNVLVFHGMGGIGKSELSRRLQAWAKGELPSEVGWGPSPATRVHATARIDLHGTRGYIDGAERLAELRTQLGSLKPRWPVFDVAFAAYWAATHPHSPLPVVGADGESAFVTPALETLKDLADDLDSPAALTSMSVRLAKQLIGGVTTRIQRRFDLAAPRGYDELFLRLATEPTADDHKPELLGRLASLLRWELDRASSPTPLVVVFIDTFERLDLDDRRDGEALLNRVAYVMPSVLFVVTGRSRLTWWEIDGPSLPRRGPSTWPLLMHGVTEEPRQHALEYLSEGDRRILLRRIRDQLELPMTDAVLEAIAEQSGGLPEYIRLSKVAALNRVRNGMPVTADAVTGSLEELVIRLFEDVPSEQEQSAIRAAALFPQCTSALVAAAAGVSDGTAQRALARPLFDVVDGYPDTFTMHDRVRAAIRDALPYARGGWSETDWRMAGTRALTHLRGLYDSAKGKYLDAVAEESPTASTEASRVIGATASAISLVCEVDAVIGATDAEHYADWLSEALVKGPSITGLRSRVPATSRTAAGREYLDFIGAKSTTLPYDERVGLLRQLSQQSSALGRIAGRHLGYTQRNAGNWLDALETFEEMLRTRPDSSLIRYQRVLTLVTMRKFSAAEVLADTLTGVQQEGIKARLSLAHGQPDAYVHWVSSAISRHFPRGTIKDAIEVEGMAVRVCTLVGARLPEGLDISELRSRAEASGHETTVRDTVAAIALRDGELAEADLRLFIAIDRARNDGKIGYREALVRVALGAAANDLGALEGLFAEVTRTRPARSYQWIPTEMLLRTHGLILPDDAGTEWRDNHDEVVARWSTIWQSWRGRLRSNSEGTSSPTTTVSSSQPTRSSGTTFARQDARGHSES